MYIKFTILTTSSIRYIRIIVHSSSLSISRTFNFPNWNSVPMKHWLPSPPPAPGPTIHFLSLDLTPVVPPVSGIRRYLSFASGLFHWASCPQGPSMLEQVSESFWRLLVILSMWMVTPCSILICSRQLGCFRLLAVANFAAVNVGVQILFRSLHPLLFGSVPRGTAWARGDSMFRLWGSSRLFPQWLPHFTFPRSSSGPHFSMSLKETTCLHYW